MSQTFQNATLGAKLELRDLTQGDLEKWMAALRKYQVKDESVPEYHGAILRAAAEVGFVIEPVWTAEAVAALDPRRARWYALKLNAVFVEATTIPPD